MLLCQGWLCGRYWPAYCHSPGRGGEIVCHWARGEGVGVRETFATPCILYHSGCGGGGELRLGRPGGGGNRGGVGWLES